MKFKLTLTHPVILKKSRFVWTAVHFLSGGDFEKVKLAGRWADQAKVGDEYRHAEFILEAVDDEE